MIAFSDRVLDGLCVLARPLVGWISCVSFGSEVRHLTMNSKREAAKGLQYSPEVVRLMKLAR